LKHGHRVLEALIELEADRRRVPLFLFLSQVLKMVVFSHHEWERSEHELRARQEFLVVDPWSHEFTRMNLGTSPLPGVPLLMSHHQIFRVGSEGTQVNEINLR
jgi:hypothetical protein